MKWFAIALFAALTVAPVVGSAQRLVPIGNIPRVEDKSPTLWGIGGYEIIYFKRSDSKFTPFERVEVADARTVEILSRAQVPPLGTRSTDFRSEMRGGKAIITVRNYLLLELVPEDAQADGKSMSDLAASWVSSLRKVLPKIAPKPSESGV